jgi:thiamine biosynthesis protein ThiS
MTIVVNGQHQETDAATILELVTALGLKPEALVVEHNRLIVREEHWQTVMLNEGDELELLSFVGGG